MTITKAGSFRQIASCASLACAAVLLTACSSSASPAAAGTATSPAGSGPATTAAGPASSSAAPGTPVSSPGSVTFTSTASASPSAAAGPTAATTFLAEAQSLTGALLHKPSCDGFGCGLSGDSTAFLFRMVWNSWSGSVAVGTGTYRIDSCDPNCAAGHVYSVATVVTLSQAVKVCSSSAAPHWVWTRASFSYPQGLPKALQGQNAPQNPWTFSALATAAQQTCTS